MIVLASISSSTTQWIAEIGVYAVFALMTLDALPPVGGELVRLFAGVLASGSVVSGPGSKAILDASCLCSPLCAAGGDEPALKRRAAGEGLKRLGMSRGSSAPGA